MPLSECRSLSAVVFAAVLGSSGIASRATAQATAPGRPPAELVAAYRSTTASLQSALANRDFAVEADRVALKPAATPLLRELVSTLTEMETALPQQRLQARNQKQTYLGLLYAIGDASTVDSVDSAAKTPDTADGRAARLVQLRSQWVRTNPSDAVERNAVLDALQAMGAAHPDDELLTLAAIALYQQPADAGQKARLVSLLTDTLKNPIAAKLGPQIKRAEVGQQQAAAAVGKPMTLAGTDSNGKALSTDAWKGKVVLVDFWATWCGPCKAELPHLREVYARYHDQGLEVLGVSCDTDADALREFLADPGLPWPQLFDAKAAADGKLNPIADRYGIDSIPRMFLIDKNGVCRSIDARGDYAAQIPKLLAE